MNTELGTILLIAAVGGVWFAVKKIRGPQAPHTPRFGGGQPLPPDKSTSPTGIATDKK